MVFCWHRLNCWNSSGNFFLSDYLLAFFADKLPPLMDGEIFSDLLTVIVPAIMPLNVPTAAVMLDGI
jgi:hypothetical protein